MSMSLDNLPWDEGFERLLVSDQGNAAYVVWDPGIGTNGIGDVSAGSWDLRDLYAHELMGEVDGDPMGGIVQLVVDCGVDGICGLGGAVATRRVVEGLITKDPGEGWREWEPGLLEHWMVNLRARHAVEDDALEGPRRLDPYERYRLEWMCEHGVSVTELLREYTRHLEGVLCRSNDWGQVERMFHVDASLPEEAIWSLEDAGSLGDAGFCWQTQDEWEEGPDRTLGAIDWNAIEDGRARPTRTMGSAKVLAEGIGEAVQIRAPGADAVMLAARSSQSLTTYRSEPGAEPRKTFGVRTASPSR